MRDYVDWTGEIKVHRDEKQKDKGEKERRDVKRTERERESKRIVDTFVCINIYMCTRRADAHAGPRVNETGKVARGAGVVVGKDSGNERDGRV